MVPWPRIISPWEVLARRLVSPVPWDSHTTCQSSALHYEPNARDMSSSMVNCIIPNTGGPILQNACGSCILYFTHLHSTSSWRTHTHTVHHISHWILIHQKKNNNGFLYVFKLPSLMIFRKSWDVSFVWKPTVDGSVELGWKCSRWKIAAFAGDFKYPNVAMEINPLSNLC